MTRRNGPLTPTGRLRMVLRHLDDGIPKAYVAAEFRVSRPTMSTWVTRYLAEGEQGLTDRPSTPATSPAQIPPQVVEHIEALRRGRTWSARRIWHHLAASGYDHDPAQEPGLFHAPVIIALRTVDRWLARLGISRLRDLTPDGDNARSTPARIRAHWPGHMIHLDVKTAGKIPNGGGWRTHGPRTRRRPSADPGPGSATPTCAPPSTGSPARPTPKPPRTRKRSPPSGSSPGPKRSSPPTASRRSIGWSPTMGPTIAPRTSPTPWTPWPPSTSASVPTRPGTTGRSNATTGYWSIRCSTPAPTSANTPDAPRWRSGSITKITTDPIPPAATSPRPHAPQPVSTTSRPLAISFINSEDTH